MIDQRYLHPAKLTLDNPLVDLAKLRIRDGRIHYFLYQQDGTKQPMSCRDTPANRMVRRVDADPRQPAYRELGRRTRREGEADTMSMLDKLRALLRDNSPREVPECLIVPPGFDPTTLPPELGPGLAGIKVVVSPHVPPGTAYILSAPARDEPRAFKPAAPLVIRPETIVKTEGVT